MAKTAVITSEMGSRIFHNRDRREKVMASPCSRSRRPADNPCRIYSCEGAADSRSPRRKWLEAASLRREHRSRGTELRESGPWRAREKHEPGTNPAGHRQSALPRFYSKPRSTASAELR